MKNIRLSIALLSWFSFLFSVCQPLAETDAAEPTESTDIISTISTATDTPKILFTATFTQEANNCTADDELPGHGILLLKKLDIVGLMYLLRPVKGEQVCRPDFE